MADNGRNRSMTEILKAADEAPLPDMPPTAPSPMLSSVDAAAAFVSYSEGVNEKIDGLVGIIDSECETLKAKADAAKATITKEASGFAKDVQEFLEKVHSTNKLLDAEHQRLAQ